MYLYGYMYNIIWNERLILCVPVTEIRLTINNIVFELWSGRYDGHAHARVVSEKFPAVEHCIVYTHDTRVPENVYIKLVSRGFDGLNDNFFFFLYTFILTISIFLYKVYCNNMSWWMRTLQGTVERGWIVCWFRVIPLLHGLLIL